MSPLWFTAFTFAISAAGGILLSTAVWRRDRVPRSDGRIGSLRFYTALAGALILGFYGSLGVLRGSGLNNGGIGFYAVYLLGGVSAGSFVPAGVTLARYHLSFWGPTAP